MRRHATPLLAALAIPFLAATAAHAQTTAQHTVTVTIPTVLRLQVGGTTSSDSRSVDFTIDGTTVTPDALTVKVFANSSWTLTVMDGGGDGPELAYQVLSAPTGTTTAQGWGTPSQNAIVATGRGPTGGWDDLELGFQVADPNAAALLTGAHTRTLTFTLTRP